MKYLASVTFLIRMMILGSGLLFWASLYYYYYKWRD